MQEPIVTLETGAFAFAGHAKHVEEALAPTAAEYDAASQSVHVAFPRLVLYLPATHNVHAPRTPVVPAAQSNSHAAKAELPAGETPPPPHEVQTLKTVAPVAPDHVPTAQFVHAALPPFVLYLPATHAVHVAPFAPVNPTLQKQAVIAVLEICAFAFAGHDEHVDEALAPTAAENFASAQSVHASLPGQILYLPATHAAHVAPFAPVNPALHEQAATAELETGAFAFAGHAEHVDEALVPATAENFPASQSVHAALPLLVLYLPATHALH